MDRDLNSLLDDAMRAPEGARLERPMLRAALEKYHVVFVRLDRNQNWFLNVWRDGLDEVANQIGAPRVSSVRSCLMRPFPFAAEHLAREFRRLHAESGKPLLVFGDPGTGPDALYTVLAHPALLTEGVVARLVVVQGAMHGSEIVDRFFLFWLGFLYRFDWLRGLLGRLSLDLTKFAPRNARPLFQEAVRDFPETARPALRRALFFTRAAIEPGGMHTLVRLSALHLGMHPPRRGGDGATLADDQIVRDDSGAPIGADLGVLNVDHWDLTHSIWFDPPELVEKRRVFVRSLLKVILPLPEVARS
jgi:hypothetical protein